MKPKIQYLVRHSKQVKTLNGELDYEIFERIFIHDSPIEARKNAFLFYEDYQTILDEAAAVREVGKSTSDFQEQYEKWSVEHPEQAEKLTRRYYAEVILQVSGIDPIDLLHDGTDEIRIHFKPLENDPMEVSELMMNLDEEYSLYVKYCFDTDNEDTRVPFWDYESYYTYAYERNLWKPDFYSLGEEWLTEHTILKTPFDWMPYSKENWWGDPAFVNFLEDHRLDKRELKQFQDHEKLIKGKESETVEFKTLLFRRILTKDVEGNPKTRDMRLEIAGVICSFLNKSGGNIYIGVNDEGKIVGVDLEGKTRDEYIRHFSQLKNSFFSSFSDVIYHKIRGNFETICGKDIFVISVIESKNEPIFLYNQERPNNTPYQFFVREGTSSIPLYDPVRMIRYIEEKWWRKKYQQS